MAKSPRWWFWIAALLPTIGLAASRWSEGASLGAEDYAQYILHARALVEGRPYTDTGYLFTPLNRGHGPAAFPPGVPLVVAAVMVVAGENDTAIKLTMFAISLAFFVLAGCYFARRGYPWLGLGVTLLLGLSAWVMRYSSHVQSDLPFCLAVWAVFSLSDRDGTWTWPRVAAITAAGFAAMAFRELGVVLVPAALVFAGLHWRTQRWKVVVPPAVWGATLVAAVAVAGLPHLVRETRWLFSNEVFDSLYRNQEEYRAAAGYALTDPFPSTQANYRFHFAAMVFVVPGLLLWMRQAYRSLLFWFAAIYGTLLMVLPFSEVRYMWSLSPLVVFGLLRGVDALAKRVVPRVEPGVVAVAASLVLAGGAIVNFSSGEWAGAFATRPEVRDLFSVLRRLDAEQPMRASFSRPRILALETGIPAMPPILQPAPKIEAELQRLCITHLVIGSLGLRPPFDRASEKMVELAPDHFQAVYANQAFSVYRYAALRPDHCPPRIRGAAAAQKLPR